MHRFLFLALAPTFSSPPAFNPPITSSSALAGAVKLSPDGTKIAYIVSRNDGPRRAIGQLFVMTLADGKSIGFSTALEGSGNPEWSPDGKWIAYSGKLGEKSGLIIAHPDGSNKKYLGPLEGTNAPLPTTGKTVTWSPDGKQIAYVSSTPGPETEDASGDPVVITRYLYKPTASEGNSHFNDATNACTFSVADVATGQSRQLHQRNPL